VPLRVFRISLLGFSSVPAGLPTGVSVRNAWTILYVAAVFRYQQVTMQQKMKAIDAAGRAKVCI